MAPGITVTKCSAALCNTMEPMPYMLINLGDVDTIYLGRDTPIAYIKGEDASCEYLEVNEIIEDVRGINWQAPRTRKMVTSDLVYSPAQVTEHRRVELKDHDISEDTRRKFKELKVQFPKVFSLNNEDIRLHPAGNHGH